jgi:hypothetical protein
LVICSLLAICLCSLHLQPYESCSSRVNLGGIWGVEDDIPSFSSFICLNGGLVLFILAKVCRLTIVAIYLKVFVGLLSILSTILLLVFLGIFMNLLKLVLMWDMKVSFCFSVEVE